MRYMMLIKHTEEYRNHPIPAALGKAVGEFITENIRKGRIVDTNGLKPSREGKRVQLKGGKLRVIDGPFTETKELVGGYAIMELESDREALEVTIEFVELHRVHWPEFECVCELRPAE